MPELGIPFQKTVSEANRRHWNILRTAPEPQVKWIIRGDGDDVDEMMRGDPSSFSSFELVKRETSPGEGGVQICRLPR